MAQASTLQADKVMDRIEAQSSEQLDLVSQFLASQQTKLAEASKIADPVLRKKNMDLVNAKFADVRKEAQGNTKGVASITAEFLAQEQNLDNTVSALETYSPEEKAQFDEAEAAVTVAKGEVETSKTAFNWFGMINPKEAAQKKLETAEQKLKQVQSELASKKRARILDADI